MPPLPGEERLLTTYADVHYYYSNPCPHPRQHRFDKGSYLYIYHDGAKNRTRIEIANNPNTPEIDAFCGSLESVNLRNSDKFPTLCTLTVDGRTQVPSGFSNQADDPDDWRLPYIDPQTGSRNYLRLHTVDIYFWTLNDVNLFLTIARRLLSPAQLDITPSPPQESSLSSVVQQLENVAVSDPANRNNQVKTPVSESSSFTPQPAVSTSAPSAQTYTTSRPVSPLEEPANYTSVKSSETTQNYVPLPYNPAAPAAPEPIIHREKTPPPPDTAAGTGIATASVINHRDSSYGPASSHAPHSQFSGQGYYHSGQPPYSSPPPRADLTHPRQTPSHNSNGSLSFPPPPAPITTGAATPSSNQSGTMVFVPPPEDANMKPYSNAPPPPGNQPGQMQFAPPPDPNMHLYRQQTFPQQSMPGQYNLTQPTPYLDRRGSQLSPAHPQIQPPIGGFAEYSYSQPNHLPPAANPHDIHAQVYRPTEAEIVGHYRDTHSDYAQGGRKPGKITESAMRVEKGVNKLFKKLEKKL
ncbi:hypothetical protein VTO42DRAFT_5712 [Malbranchea cinnamomea]